MNRFSILLVLSFLGSVSSIFASRGVYFFTDAEFQFTQAQNLWLGLGSGIAYILGALPSHRLAMRYGDRKVMLWSIVFQIVSMAAMFFSPTPLVIILGQLAFQFFNATMWPVVEAFVSAGRSPRETARALGRFNVTWALATPLGVLWVGPIIKDLSMWLFGIGALLFVAVGFLTLFLPARMTHLPDDHPDRLHSSKLARCKELLISSRWLLIYSYALFFLLVPLFPELFGRLGYDVEEKTRLASVIDFARWLTFIVLHLVPWWHDRTSILWASIVLLPASVILVLLVPDAGVILAAEIVFGITEGVVYYAALYYAMIVKNASVDAGGAHESLIGLGYSIGPVCGLIGFSIGGKDWMLQFWPMLVGIGPLFVVCTIGAVLPLLRLRKA